MVLLPLENQQLPNGSKKIGATYIDTGAMYRAVTYFALSQNIDPKDESAVVSLLPKLKLDIKEDERIF